MRGQIGQSAENQINNLEDLEAYLSEHFGVGKLWQVASAFRFLLLLFTRHRGFFLTPRCKVKSGYVNSTSEDLAKLLEIVGQEGLREKLVDLVRVGVHRGVPLQTG